jgi:hypothetical protein
LSPGGSGFNMCTKTYGRIPTKLYIGGGGGGLHDKHLVATWILGNHLSICFKDTGKPRKKTCIEVAGRRTYNVILQCFRSANVAVEKGIIITYSKCVVLFLVIQDVMCIGLICFVTFPDAPHSSTYSEKRRDFGKQYWVQNVFFGFVYNSSRTFFILRDTEGDVVNEYWSSCKIAVTLLIVKRNFNFPSIAFRRIMKYWM